MDKQRRYTAQELHEQSRWFHYRAACFPMNRAFDVAEKMLQQAADTEEELAELRTQLAAIEKKCEKMRYDLSERMHSFTGAEASNMRNIYKVRIQVIDDILRTARRRIDGRFGRKSLSS